MDHTLIDPNGPVLAHNALATAHGLTANISAALTGAESPSAGNVLMTDSAVDALIAAEHVPVAVVNSAFSFLPFTVERLGRTFRPAGGWDVSVYAPTGKTYYVSSTGSDANTGLSLGQALAKVSTAVAKADVDVVLIDDGEYPLNGAHAGWGGTAASRSISVKAINSGMVRLTQRDVFGALTWALNGTYTNTYTTTRNFVGSVFDASIVDSNGDYQKLTLRASAAEVEANPGSWYYSSPTLYVRTTDSRAPDTNLMVYIAGSVVGFASGDFVTYVEGIAFEGTVQAQTNAGGQTPKLYAKNCTFKYSPASGMSCIGADFYGQDCTAAMNANDGFSVNTGSTTVKPNRLEIRCIGRDNGSQTGADNYNGGTSHDTSNVVLIESQYYRNVGPNGAEIGGAMVWALGSTFHTSLAMAAGNRSNFTCQGTAWLDRCTAYGSTYNLVPYPGYTTYTRLCTLTGINGGTGSIIEY